MTDRDSRAGRQADRQADRDTDRQTYINVCVFVCVCVCVFLCVYETPFCLYPQCKTLKLRSLYSNLN